MKILKENGNVFFKSLYNFLLHVLIVQRKLLIVILFVLINPLYTCNELYIYILIRIHLNSNGHSSVIVLNMFVYHFYDSVIFIRNSIEVINVQIQSMMIQFQSLL